MRGAGGADATVVECIGAANGTSVVGSVGGAEVRDWAMSRVYSPDPCVALGVLI